MRNDLQIYERNAEEWWDPRSKTFRSLRSVNAFREGLIREWFGDHLRGAQIADLGCGGGLLSEFFLRADARVIGVDVSHRSLLAAARRRQARAALYVRGDLARSP